MTKQEKGLRIAIGKLARGRYRTSAAPCTAIAYSDSIKGRLKAMGVKPEDYVIAVMNRYPTL